MLVYRADFLTGFFSGFLFVAIRFFFLEMFLLPGREIGGRIDTPGSPIGVIQNTMISSVFFPYSII
jgi:hypothetical protein